MNKRLKVHEFPNGMTIAELKELLKDIPDTDADGKPYEVWMETAWCLSSPVKAVWPLNQREDGQDIIFETYRTYGDFKEAQWVSMS